MPTIAPAFPRLFAFPLPLFANPGGQTSPWRTKVVDLKPADVSLRQSESIYQILKTASEESLQDNQQKLDVMVAAGTTNTEEFGKLKKHILRLQEALLEGGAMQNAWVAHDQYAFPIYATRRDDGGQLETIDLPIGRYDCNISGISPKNVQCDHWEPAWAIRSGNAISGWVAHGVPVPELTAFAAGRPASLRSDGNIVLFDAPTGMEYDFWQVTMQTDTSSTNPAGHSLGGGLTGPRMLWTGSVSAFQSTGRGVRNPLIDPINSSRATGLPYLGGLLLPEDFAEAAGGWIEHALAFVLPRLRFIEEATPSDPPNWIFPATRTETFNSIADPWALAAGQRITLSETLTFSGQHQIGAQEIINDTSIPLVTRSFLRAIREYGAYLVDGGGGFGFATEDSMTASPQYSESHLKLLVGNRQLETSNTLWANIIDELDEWLSWRLGNHLFGVNSGLAFAHKDDSGTLHPNFQVVKDL